METPLQQATRLLAALDQLIEQEGMYLRGGYYDLATEIRDRTEPLVRQLVRLEGQPGVTGLRPQIETFLTRSASHAAFLQEKMTELRQEISRTAQARQRTNQMRPAYAGTPVLVASRFQATG